MDDPGTERQGGQLLTSLPDVHLPPTPSLSAPWVKISCVYWREAGNRFRHIITICIWGCLLQWVLMRQPDACGRPRLGGEGGQGRVERQPLPHPLLSGARADLPSPHPSVGLSSSMQSSQSQGCPSSYTSLECVYYCSRNLVSWTTAVFPAPSFGATMNPVQGIYAATTRHPACEDLARHFLLPYPEQPQWPQRGPGWPCGH